MQYSTTDDGNYQQNYGYNINQENERTINTRLRRRNLHIIEEENEETPVPRT